MPNGTSGLPIDDASPSPGAAGVYGFFALACALTWLLAAPLVRASARHHPASPYAVAGAGLSALGPLLAALAIAGPRRELPAVFGRWSTHVGWVALALIAPAAVKLVGTALFVAIGGHPARWFDPPSTPAQIAALVIFPLAEEFGWRGFAYPRLARRHGAVRASLIVGAVWGVWHLMYTFVPSTGALDLLALALIVVELPLYSLLIAWVFERSGRSMAVAIAFHAGAHLDNFQRAPRTDLRLQALHLAVLGVAALAAGRALARPRDRPSAPH